MSEIIKLDKLTRKFGSMTAVKDVSFGVEKGSIFGFLGPNGSGKSTVIRMLCGLLEPTSGDAWLDGASVRENSERIKGNIGYMSQSFSLYRDLTVQENLAFYGKIYGLRRERLRKRIEESMELSGITSKRKQLSGTLSGGWKQRLALACSMLHEPGIIFLDEPTAGIDPVARRDLWELLFQLSKEGVTLFVTTHYMDEAERCTHIGYIFLSELMVCGKPAELKILPEVTPAGTVWLEASSDRITQALSLIKKAPGVLDATIFGESIHIRAREGFGEREAARALEAGGVSLESFRAVKPSLEDVFVSLTRERLKARGAA
ncbi:MAG TPA: ABC transporter ATP-binding protein [bacterium]|nr:MAG: putative ABC transporter ATP-binding protein YbhF [bacterium ADurb.Bin236]HOY63000.1 ABC transporter ATP-binding protein [bacterium]HPI76812.1 ABC transporter ATP-binding protein [bacterium]HPN94194.1 ABC transporter ATP-binding protein [bacterium]